MIVCPNCNSPRIANFRLDSDWGYGGDWGKQNDDFDGYTEEDEKSFSNNERPDIQCYVCCECSTCFG